MLGMFPHMYPAYDTSDDYQGKVFVVGIVLDNGPSVTEPHVLLVIRPPDNVLVPVRVQDVKFRLQWTDVDFREDLAHAIHALAKAWKIKELEINSDQAADAVLDHMENGEFTDAV